jgi:hypothetical protein
MLGRFRPETRLRTGKACCHAHAIEQILPLPSTKLVETGNTDAIGMSVYQLWMIAMASSPLSRANE